MFRRLACATAATLAAVAFTPQPSRAEIYATNESMCEEAATAKKPPVGEDAVT